MGDIQQFDVAVRNSLAASDRNVKLGSTVEIVGALTLDVPLPIAGGGTGATSAAAALAALGGVGAGSHSLKRGTGLANYTRTAAAFASIDSTNLDVTVTVAAGQLAIALLLASGNSAAAAGQGFIGVGVDGTAPYTSQMVGTSTDNLAAAAVLVGDGASHTFSPQFAGDGTNQFSIINSSAAKAPLFLVLLISAT